jgi:hypothetical protein
MFEWVPLTSLQPQKRLKGRSMMAAISERESLEDRLFGCLTPRAGCAVAAYTRGYRFTKDIDLVADKPARSSQLVA